MLDPAKTYKFIIVAALLMIILDTVFYFPKAKPPAPDSGPPPEKIFEHSEIEDFESGTVVLIKRPEEWQVAGLPLDIPQPDAIKNNADIAAKIVQHPASLKIEKVTVMRPRPPRPVIKGKGLVAIIIDDMGMDRKHSYQAVELPGPLTLAFLPYAPGLAGITKAAQDKGHELLIHVPMQPVNRHLDPGPLVLRDDMTEEGFNLALEKIFGSFEGYVGINNHMGSKLTQDRAAMDQVMEALAKRNLLFIESVTIASSVAAQAAADQGLAYNARDIFLDNENNKEFVIEALYQLEKLAKRRGYAIAIGHPKAVTIEALKEWLPELKKRGLTLVPVSRLAKKPAPLQEAIYGPVRAQAPPP